MSTTRAPLQFDDTYTGRRFTYGLTSRPLALAQVPDGWIIGSDRTHTAFPHGTVDYDRELTPREVEQFSLTETSRWTGIVRALDLTPGQIVDLHRVVEQDASDLAEKINALLLQFGRDDFEALDLDQVQYLWWLLTDVHWGQYGQRPTRREMVDALAAGG